MTTLAEIEAAVESLPLDQKEHLLHFLTVRLRSLNGVTARSRLIQSGADTLLEASPEAPPMTPANAKRILEDWP